MSVSASSVQDNTFSFAKKTADAIKRAVGLDTPKKPEPQPAPPAGVIPAEKVNPVASANALAERCRLPTSTKSVKLSAMLTKRTSVSLEIPELPTSLTPSPLRKFLLPGIWMLKLLRPD